MKSLKNRTMFFYSGFDSISESFTNKHSIRLHSKFFPSMNLRNLKHPIIGEIRMKSFFK